MRLADQYLRVSLGLCFVVGCLSTDIKFEIKGAAATVNVSDFAANVSNAIGAQVADVGQVVISCVNGSCHNDSDIPIPPTIPRQTTTTPEPTTSTTSTTPEPKTSTTTP